MTEDTRSQEPPAMGRRATDLMAELISELNRAEQPLDLGDLSLRLGRNFRSIAWVLTAACNTGTVDRLEGGRYELPVRPALIELFAFVRECEARWELAPSATSMNNR